MLVAGNFSDPVPGMGWFLHCASPKPRVPHCITFWIQVPPYLWFACRSPSQSLVAFSCVVATRLELEQLGIAYNELTRLLTLIPEFLGVYGVLWYVMIIPNDHFDQDRSNQSCSRMSQRAVGMRWRDSTHAQQKPQEVSGNTRGAASDGAWWSHAMTC